MSEKGLEQNRFPTGCPFHCSFTTALYFSCWKIWIHYHFYSIFTKSDAPNTTHNLSLCSLPPWGLSYAQSRELLSCILNPKSRNIRFTFTCRSQNHYVTTRAKYWSPPADLTPVTTTTTHNSTAAGEMRSLLYIWHAVFPFHSLIVSQ